MKAYKSFFKNTLIFSLSSMGSKAATLALLPMYSYSITLSEFGEVDIALTLVMLLMPLLSASLYESVQKYCITGTDKKERVLSTGLLSFLLVAVITGLIVTLLYQFVFPSNKILLLYFVLVFMSIYEFFARFAKGTRNEFNFAISNILISVVLLSCNYVLVYIYGVGIVGILLSQAIAYFSGLSFLYFKLNLSRFLSFSSFDSSLLRKMLKLSAPLMLNAAMWWIFDVSDRWIILYFEDTEVVGLYSVAYKLAAVLLLVHTIIFQSWQISAIEHKNDSTRAKFYSNISEIYLIVVVTCASVLILMNRFILETALTSEYSDAWLIGNLLFLATTFFCLASFFGVFYVVFEKTTRALQSSILAAVLNIILNLVFIPKFGAFGAAIATIISTFVLFSFRIFDIQQLCKFEFNKVRLLIFILLLGLQVYFSANSMASFSLIITLLFTVVLLITLNSKYKSLVGNNVE